MQESPKVAEEEEEEEVVWSVPWSQADRTRSGWQPQLPDIHTLPLKVGDKQPPKTTNQHSPKQFWVVHHPEDGAKPKSILRLSQCNGQTSSLELLHQPTAIEVHKQASRGVLLSAATQGTPKQDAWSRRADRTTGKKYHEIGPFQAKHMIQKPPQQLTYGPLPGIADQLPITSEEFPRGHVLQLRTSNLVSTDLDESLPAPPTPTLAKIVKIFRQGEVKI